MSTPGKTPGGSKKKSPPRGQGEKPSWERSLRASLGGALRRWGGKSNDYDDSTNHDSDGNNNLNIGAK